MKKIVQKFGGTSLDNENKRLSAARKVKDAMNSGFFPVVVVSAMGRLGNPYSTDTLIQLAEKIFIDIPAREKDLLMSCGEIISTVVMVQTLKKIGIDSLALTGAQAGIITDNRFGRSAVKSVDSAYLLNILNQGKVPIVAGFQGITKSGEITTLGRGGSDTTASVIAAAINALFIEIYTDVEGVMTADPLIVNEAQILEEVSYNEACELAYQGAGVIHPRAAEIAMNEKIPIKIKSTFENNNGTLIHNYGLRDISGDRPVTGIASRNNILFIKVYPDEPAEYATGLRVFKLLSNHDISVDFINIRPRAISFIVDDKCLQNVSEILKEYNFNYDLSEEYVKVSVVGGGMTGQPGIMARIVEALSAKDIAIFQTTDSHTTISCLVKKEKEKDAVKILHRAFGLNKIKF